MIDNKRLEKIKKKGKIHSLLQFGVRPLTCGHEFAVHSAMFHSKMFAEILGVDYEIVFCVCSFDDEPISGETRYQIAQMATVLW